MVPARQASRGTPLGHHEDDAGLGVEHEVASGTDPEHVLALLAERACRTFLGAAGIFMLDGGRLVAPASGRGIDPAVAEAAAAACGELRGGFIVNNWPRWRAVAPAAAARARHVMACPVLAGGRLRGAVAVSRGGDAAVPFTAAELGELQRLAVRASVGVRLLDLRAVGERRDEQLRALGRLGRLVSSAPCLEDALRGIARTAAEVTGTAMAGVWVADEERRLLRLRALSGADVAAGPVSTQVWGRGVVGRAAALRRPVAGAGVTSLADGFERGWLAEHGLRAALALPAVTPGGVAAVLALFGHGPLDPDEVERELLRALTGYVAAALSGALRQGERALPEAGRPVRPAPGSRAGDPPERLEVFYAVARRLAAVQETDATVSAVLDEAVRLLGADGASLRLADRGRLELVGCTPSLRPLRQRPWLGMGESLSGLAARLGEAVASESMPDDPRCHPQHRKGARALGFHGFLAVPMTVGDRLVGALSVFWRERKRAEPEEVTLLSALADQGALALARARAFDHLREAATRQAAQFAVTRVLAESATVDDATPRLLRALCEGLGWEAGEAWTLEPGARVLRWQAMWHLPGLDLVEFAASGRELTLAAGSGLPGRCLATGRPVWMPDVTRDPGFVRAASARRAGLRAAFAFPVLAGDECLGVLVFFSRAIREPDRELLQMVADVGAQIGQFTRRRMAEEALRRSEEQLRQAQRLDAIGRLTGGIAHDFSNLLSVILSYSEMLIERLDERDPARPTIVQVRKAALRAASLTRQLLAFARRQVLQPRVLDLNAVVVDVTTMLRRFIGENVRLVTRLAPDLGAVRMDPAQLGQVLMNLAINARDAMPSGGVLTIETANVRVGEEGPPARPGPGDWVMLAVSDTGHGMDAATRSRIFEPFFTTKAPGRGTGLGLSTVHGIVKQSGGEIDVESEPNRGAKFRIYLPRVAASPAAETEAVTAAAPLGDETILLVEDEEAVRDLARSILESAGYTVLAAAGGEAALDIARRHPGPIHVLLTDVVMPEMSGRELARRLGEERPGAKVLFMTGYGYEAVGPGGLLEEGAELMEKPFTPAVLLRRIAAVLRGGRRDDG